MPLPITQAVERLVQNEERLDRFLNDDTGYTTTDGRPVESVPAFLERVEQEIEQGTGTVAANLSAAQAAQVGAEAARDAAQLSSGVYETTAAGLAAVASGRYFSVPSSDISEYLILYKNASGVAQFINIYPSAYGLNSKVTEVSSKLSANGVAMYKGSGPVWPLATDSQRRVILGYDETSGALVGDGLVSEEEAYYQAKRLMTDTGMANYTGSGPVYPIYTDRNYRVLLGYDTVKKAIVGVGGLSSGEGTSPEDYLPANLKPTSRAINHLLFYGQSLSVGATGLPVLSTAQPYSNLTFNGGPRAAGADYSGLKPLVEDAVVAPDGGGNRGETPCSGAANYAITLAAVENGLLPSQHVVLATTAGHGGYRISQLNKSTSWYSGVLLAHFQNAFTLNSDYACHAFAWMQGENDAGLVTQAEYYNALLQLQADVEADVKAISGQAHPVFCLTYQMSYDAATHKEVALAQLAACQTSDRFYLATPCYHLPFATDNVHLTNVGYKWIGAYFGRAYKRLVIDGKRPEWLNPKSAVRRGTKVILSFDVPRAPLVLDTTTLASTTDYGFQVRDGGGTPVGISGVEVLNGSEVHLTLAAEPSGQAIVRYALDYRGTGLTFSGGASGNLRDSTPETISISGVSRPLYHVCPHFELPIVTLGE